MLLAQAAIVVCFVCIHSFANKLRFIEAIPRSRWLSFAGGASVSYVFLHVFPELVEAHSELSKHSGWPYAEQSAYLVALLGVTTFYGLERLVKFAQDRRNSSSGGSGETSTGTEVFWVHTGSFAFYNFLIGYLLVHEDRDGFGELGLFAAVFGLHFLINDFSMREDHKNTYDRIGRWLMSGAILAGWLVGLTSPFSEVVISSFFAFLAGGIVLNVLKEELPESRQGRFIPFALGVASYTSLMLMGE